MRAAARDIWGVRSEDSGDDGSEALASKHYGWAWEAGALYESASRPI